MAHQRRLEEERRKREEDRRARVERLKREYGHLSPEEFYRKVAEDERRTIQEDPRYIAVVRQGERERAAREAEVKRQKRLWISSGNPAEEFEPAWPRIKQEVLMERRRAFLERTERDSVV
jgi:hypothetical protein